MYYNQRISVFDLEDHKDAIPDNYLRQIRTGELFAGQVFDLVGDEKRDAAVYVIGHHRQWMELSWVHFGDADALPVVKADLIRYIIRIERAQADSDLKGVFFELHSDEVEDPDELRHILMMAGLYCRESMDYIYSFTLDQVKEREFLAKASGAMECITLKDADDKLLDELDNRIQCDDRPTPVGLFVDWDDYTAEDSVICVKNGRPRGALLLSMKNDCVVIECAYVADRMALSAMLGNVLPGLEEKYGPWQQMLVPVVLRKTAEIVERLVPDAKRGRIIEGIKWF